jgi:ribosomal protein S18 acetylase RimI-like enzyme
MVAEAAPPPRAARDEIVALGAGDVDAMLALAAAAKPGPFGRRTPELGRYFGVRDGSGRLLAMVGERMRVPGGIELSALAVDAAARGRGLGAALMRHLTALHRDEGATTFLHVFPDNPAVALYARLRFRERARLVVIWRRPLAAA